MDWSNDTYIFMSFVDGQPLDIAWNDLDYLTKTRIASQLKTYIDDLRTMGRMTYIGSADHSPVTDLIFATCPFDSEKEFNEAIVEAYHLTVPRQHIQKFLFGMIAHKERHVAFAHGDLRPPNIMIKDGNVAAIIDWELSG
ncbi:hypothetical protein ANOM_006587 [Aspergillus nomiae NRRL 13137]|uniref:Aminoglycoside phosphotransferase domain-containing protein n=1 Tax=Aspergillus nomiae NRRL (strain ATCC 15546 / NRRL 13137 / CBS 260.88 / M93) TaxID=1509407 RepID=A0A0L1J3Z8_ASPN3|nr:uncharacterized protein ANOM_006587 [Aspergillus nomiae NRRL 13137]KNG86163.1 hypothetical protein ANOM_006587 [Aspergillus nomiae NRRL 13137]